MNPVHETEPYILVEGPRWADAEFYGNWLLTATKTQALWEKAIKDPRFKKQIDLLTAHYSPDFDHSASLFLFQLKKNLVSFTIPLHNSEDWAELDQFTLMTEMGFFVLTDGRYQMVVPAKMNIDVVKSAVLRFAKTEDEDEPSKYLVASMPYAQAEEWQARLRDMDEEQRCADRAVLLDENFAKQLDSGKVGGCCERLDQP